MFPRTIGYGGALPAPVSQPVEEAVSNTVQCGFESHPGHTRLSVAAGMLDRCTNNVFGHVLSPFSTLGCPCLRNAPIT